MKPLLCQYAKCKPLINKMKTRKNKIEDGCLKQLLKEPNLEWNKYRPFYAWITQKKHTEVLVGIRTDV